MKIDKNKHIVAFLVILLAISLSYIGWTAFSGYMNSMAYDAYFQGYSAAIQDVILEAKKEECLVFPVVLEEDRVDLVNVECLSFQEEEFSGGEDY